MRKALIAFFLFIGPFPLHAQQQNEGDSPSGKIHFVVRGDDVKKIYLSVPSGNSQEVELCETPGWGNLVIPFLTGRLLAYRAGRWTKSWHFSTAFSPREEREIHRTEGRRYRRQSGAAGPQAERLPSPGNP
jgi:hypothetical protein